MATKVATAIRVEAAIQRLIDVSIALGEGLPTAQLMIVPRRGRDKEVLRATQLEAIADWLEAVAATSPPNKGQTHAIIKTPKRKKRLRTQSNAHGQP